MSAHPTCQLVYKVVLVGCFGVGKTSLFWRLKTGQFMEHHETEESGRCLSDRCTVNYVMQSGDVVQVRSAVTLCAACRDGTRATAMR